MAKSEKTAMFLPVFLFIYKHHFLHLGFIDPFDLSNGWWEGVATKFVPMLCNVIEHDYYIFLFTRVFLYFFKGKTSFVRGL
jgi:hypothetical protein